MRTLLSLFLFLLCHACMAHTGGHHTHTAANRSWTLLDGTPLATKGAYLSQKNGSVSIEMLHEVVSVPIANLSEKDQAFVKLKKETITALNQVHSANENTSTRSKSIPLWAYGLAIALLLLSLFSLLHFRLKKVLVASASVVLICFLVFETISCANDESGSEDPSTELSTLDASEIATAFEVYSDLVSTTADDDYVYVESTGIPNHQMMVGITAWIAQVPIPFPFEGNSAWSIPIHPEYADETVSIESELRRGALGLAANGIPIFNPINASGLISKEIGELDEFGGHSGRGDDYHYHTAPLHLESTSGSQPIAFALDGFAVYGSKEPDGADMEELDEYHGHEYNGMYHYHGTESYPYMVAKMRGKVTLGGTSPETQIEPQPVAQALRKEVHPINSDNLIITSLTKKTAGNGYVLTYTIDGVEGSVDYYWDEDELYTFIFNDVDGTTTTETYQR